MCYRDVSWPGKRQLRGQVAQFEGRSSYQDVPTTRLELVQATQVAFFEYYAAQALLRLNAQNVQALQSFRGIAVTRDESNLVSQQDVLQADVELATLGQRRIERQRMQWPSRGSTRCYLCLPTRRFLRRLRTCSGRVPYPAADVPRQMAASGRPEISAILNQIRAQQSAVALANKEFRPDVEMIGRYDKFWQGANAELQSQFGFTTNVPHYKQKRYAAVREA